MVILATFEELLAMSWTIAILLIPPTITTCLLKMIVTIRFSILNRMRQPRGGVLLQELFQQIEIMFRFSELSPVYT